MKPPGRMTTRITIEHKTRERDHRTNEPEKWDKLCDAFCSVEISPGGEPVTETQVRANDVWKFETNWTPTNSRTTPRMRVALVDGRLLQIKSAVNEGVANRTLVLVCEETK